MDKKRYFELLSKEKALRAKDLVLDNINPLEGDELREYQIILEKQFFYQNRSSYIDLIQKCIEGQINCWALQWSFFEIYYDDLKILDEKMMSTDEDEINFYTDSKIENFSLSLDELEAICELLDDLVTEDDFYIRLKKMYSDIQKYDE
jgi:hypothetical protein